ncbi:hypothetical protein [Actinomyces gerencseriae]|uniref:hypothetical protein n=1 Tax=Actinomyces gerencseriae TaxID=52769 RepID=UPI0003FCAB74|nr:hypothetical protein [Actinomyces gerencseriae]
MLGGGRHAAAPARGRHAAPEHVRFGVPFNGVVPIWHDNAEITWHRATDGTDFTTVLGLGVVETEPGPSDAPEGWVEIVETGTLLTPGADPADIAAGAESGPILRLRAEAPTGRRAFNDPRRGAAIPLSPALTVEEAMGPSPADFDITGFTVHLARLMLRAARDGAILLFTLRAPRDPEPHHVLSIPSDVDSEQVMHFHLGTLLEMEGGAWDHAGHADGMALLDLDVPYSRLLADSGPDEEQGFETAGLIEMAQPVVDAVLKPGYPFALGSSFIMPRG